MCCLVPDRCLLVLPAWPWPVSVSTPVVADSLLCCLADTAVALVSIAKSSDSESFKNIDDLAVLEFNLWCLILMNPFFFLQIIL